MIWVMRTGTSNCPMVKRASLSALQVRPLSTRALITSRSLRRDRARPVETWVNATGGVVDSSFSRRHHKIESGGDLSTLLTKAWRLHLRIEARRAELAEHSSIAVDQIRVGDPVILRE